MRVLVFGVTGFIGRNLFSYLKNELVVTAGVTRDKGYSISDSRFDDDLFFIDKVEPAENEIDRIFQSFKPDKVINSISYFERMNSPLTVDNYVNANLEIPLILLKKCMKYQSDLINLSSYWQFSEGNQFNSWNLYTASKNAFETLFQFFLRKRMIRGCSIVLHETYGENDNRDKIINLVFASIKNNAPLVINDIDSIINLTHVSDVVRGIHSIIRLNNYEKYYEIMNNENVSISRIIDKIETFIPVSHLLKKEKVQRLDMIKTYNRTPFPSPPSWKPIVPLDQGLFNLYKFQSKCSD